MLSQLLRWAWLNSSAQLQTLTPEALMAGLNIGQKAALLLLVYISLDALMR